MFVTNRFSNSFFQTKVSVLRIDRSSVPVADGDTDARVNRYEAHCCLRGRQRVRAKLLSVIKRSP